MGIFEFHFHESEFKFAPSISNKGGETTDHDADSETDLSIESDTTSTPEMSKTTSESGSTMAKGVGVLVGLAFLVTMGALGKKLVSKRLGGEPEDEDEFESESPEETIEIAD